MVIYSIGFHRKVCVGNKRYWVVLNYIGWYRMVIAGIDGNIKYCVVLDDIG